MQPSQARLGQQSGFVTVTGLAFLENPRRPYREPAKALTLAFDASFRLEDAAEATIPGFALAFLTYFNGNGIAFSEDPTPYFITAKIAQVEHRPTEGNNQPIKLSADGSALDNLDYAFVGEIMTLIPANPQTTPQSAPSLYITASWFVDRTGNFDSNSPTEPYFEICPPQYVPIYYKKFGLAFKSSIRLRCWVKDSPRWTASTKPRPKLGKVVTISGYLEKATRNTDSKTVEYLDINVDQVSYLADIQLPSTAANTLDAISTPLKGKTKLSAQLSATPSMMSSPVAVQSEEPEEPASKRPKLTPDSSFSSIGSQPETPSPPAATQANPSKARHNTSRK